MRNVQILYVVTINFKCSVCYCFFETLLGKRAKPNQTTQYDFNNRVFVISRVELLPSFKFTSNMVKNGKNQEFYWYLVNIEHENFLILSLNKK